MGGLLRGGRRGFGSGGRAFNGAAILTRHLVAFSTRQWRRCRLGSRPPSAGRGAHCLADRTGLPGKGRELRRGQGALGRGRALTLASGLRARAAAGRETWPRRGGPAPAPGSANGEPRSPLGEGAVDGSWAARGERKDGLRGACATRSLGCRPPFFFLFFLELFRRAGWEAAPSSSPAGAALRSRPEAAGRPHPPLSGRAAPAGGRAGGRPSPAPSPLRRGPPT